MESQPTKYHHDDTVQCKHVAEAADELTRIWQGAYGYHVGPVIKLIRIGCEWNAVLDDSRCQGDGSIGQVPDIIGEAYQMDALGVLAKHCAKHLNAEATKHEEKARQLRDGASKIEGVFNILW